MNQHCCHDREVVGDRGRDPFVRQSLQVVAVEDIVDTESGEKTMVGGAETASLLHKSIGEQFGGLLIDI